MNGPRSKCKRHADHIHSRVLRPAKRVRAESAYRTPRTGVTVIVTRGGRGVDDEDGRR